MADYSICNKVSWVDNFQQQKLYYPTMQFCEQVSLCSGDGFSVSLPAHFLLAASKLARNIFLPNLTSHVVFLPSVRGPTLLMLVEILRNGETSCLGLTDSMVGRVKEVQDALELLRISGCAALMRVYSGTGKVQDFLDDEERSEIKNLKTSDHTPLSPIDVVLPAGSPTSGGVEANTEDSKNFLDANDNLLDITVDSDKLKNDVVAENISDGYFQISDQDFELKKEMSPSEAYNGDLIRCDYCQSTFSKRYNLVRHMKKSHKDMTYPCEECGQLFVDENTFKRHVLCHIKQPDTGSQSSCQLCQEKNISRKELHRHMKKRHCELMFPCGVCGKHFIIEKNLDCHIKSAHGGTRFQCDQCPKNFGSKVVLRAHVKNFHNDCMFACPQCPSVFRYDHNLKRHMKQFHENKVLD